MFLKFSTMLVLVLSLLRFTSLGMETLEPLQPAITEPCGESLNATGCFHFNQVRKQIQPKTNLILDIFSSANLETIFSVSNLKKLFRTEYTRQVHICYARFQLCSRQLSAAFCASPVKNIAFYLWAHKMATNIMEGTHDGQKDVKCSPALIKAISERGGDKF